MKTTSRRTRIFAGLAAGWLACTAGTAADLESLAWLLGAWAREGRQGAVHEVWSRVGERIFEGRSFRESGPNGDAVTLENLLLVEMGGEVYYVAKVPENRHPIPFALTGLVGQTATFENPTHDFPQRIIYEQHGDGSLTVVVDAPGKESATRHRLEYRFRREGGIAAPPGS